MNNRLTLINTLDRNDYKIIEVLLRKENWRPRVNEMSQIKIDLLRSRLQAPLNYIDLGWVTENGVACSADSHVSFASFMSRSRDDEIPPIEDKEFFEDLRELVSSGCFFKRYESRILYDQIELISSGGLRYSIFEGRSTYDGIRVSTIPNFKKIDPRVMKVDTENLLGILQKISNRAYEMRDTSLSLPIETTKPSDEYSLPAQFYK